MSDTQMVLSMDVLKALNPDATEKTVAEFDAKGSLHLVERDEEGNDISDYEVRDKHFVDFSDLPSLDKRVAMVKKKAKLANINFYVVLSILGLLTAAAIYIIVCTR